MLSREKRRDCKAMLFGDLIAKMEQRQKLAHNGKLIKSKATAPNISAHGSVPPEAPTPPSNSTTDLKSTGGNTLLSIALSTFSEDVPPLPAARDDISPT